MLEQNSRISYKPNFEFAKILVMALKLLPSTSSSGQEPDPDRWKYQRGIVDQIGSAGLLIALDE
jgi:hypothetical protein